MNVRTLTDNLRRHGSAPFSVAAIHGGPGAAGEMAPVARRLAEKRGVLEPLQTATTLEGQVEELRETLVTHAARPCTLVGYSWGAWLGFILAARHPALVAKLVLVSSGPFEERYTAAIHETRLARLGPELGAEFETLLAALRDPEIPDPDRLLARLGALAAQGDGYDLLPDEEVPLQVQGTLFQQVWQEAAALRRSGELLALGGDIACPVVALHGAHDPHPAAGVREPLSTILHDFRFILLEHCGHTPWRERCARETFYRVLEAEITNH